MKKLMSLALLASTLSCGTATATIISGNSLQQQLNSAGARINVQNDQYDSDERWQIGAAGLAGARLLFELAGFANSNAFGIYDITNASNSITVFQGPSGAGARGLLAAEGNYFCAALVWSASPSCSTFGSELFGFFLATPQGTFYSQAGRNSDGVDHMVAFEGGSGRGSIGGRPWRASEFILAWEDLFGGGDRDYDDFGVLVGPIVSVAEPGSLALVAIGLLGLLGMLVISRRRARAHSR